MTVGNARGCLDVDMRVYAPWPGHHARTSPDVFNDFSRHSANVGFLALAAAWSFLISG